MISSEIVISVKNLKKNLSGVDILKDISFDLMKGENLVILGKSGTGKSVLIKCLIGLMQPTAGNTSILGANFQTLPESELDTIRLRLGFLFQGAALYDSMSVRENIEFPLIRTLGLTDNDVITEKVEKALEDVGMLDAIDKMPSELSGGMRKRVGLARTLILDPEIIFYDEPTTGLDPITSNEISNLINEIQNKHKASSIIITHDILCAKKVANRLVMINDGVIYAQGTFDELSNSSDNWIRSFFY